MKRLRFGPAPSRVWPRTPRHVHGTMPCSRFREHLGFCEHHQAKVEIHIERDGLISQISQLGPDFVILADVDDYEGPAKITLTVDGVAKSCDVWVHTGSTNAKKTIVFLRRNEDVKL